MRYKPDWDKAKERLTAFWHQEIVDRCCAAIYVYENGAKAPERVVPGTDEERVRYWTDPEQIIQPVLIAWGEDGTVVAEFTIRQGSFGSYG